MEAPGRQSTTTFTPMSADANTVSGTQNVTFTLKLDQHLGYVRVTGTIDGGPIPANVWVALFSAPPDPNNPTNYLWWAGSYVTKSPFEYQSNQISGSGYYGAVSYPSSTGSKVVLTIGPT